MLCVNLERVSYKQGLLSSELPSTGQTVSPEDYATKYLFFYSLKVEFLL
jgi:hypothetical protein